MIIFQLCNQCPTQLSKVSKSLYKTSLLTPGKANKQMPESNN